MKLCKDCKHWLPWTGGDQSLSACGRYSREPGPTQLFITGDAPKKMYADTCRISGPCKPEAIGFEPKELTMELSHAETTKSHENS